MLVHSRPKVFASVVISTLSLISCGKSFSNFRSGVTAPPQPQAFNLVDSQLCGTTPPAQLPTDPTATAPIDLGQLESAMKTTGVTGWIHGAVPAWDQYVFTYRDTDASDPMSFFRFVELSLVPANDQIRAQLQAYKRNDKVQIVGSFLPIPAPQKHVLVTATSLVQPYQTSEQPYHHQAQLPSDLDGLTTIYGVVHAQAMSGGALAIEYKDAVVPVFVQPQHRATVATLYRGDIVKLHFTLQAIPPQPLHLETDPSDANAVEIVDHLVWCDQKPATLTGQLVLFPKSPEITMDIYALRVTDANGMQRNFTLTSDLDTDTDMSIFSAIHDKAAKAWAAGKATAVQGRNQLINPKIKVTAKGTMNEVSQDQANPQIYLPGPDQVTFETLP